MLSRKCRDKPVNVTVTLDDPVVALDDTITVTALSGFIAAGNRLAFSNGLVVYTTEDADAGATTIAIEPATGTAVGTETASYVAKTRIISTSSLGFNINNSDSTFQTHDDANGFSDGVITSADWSIPVEGQWIVGSATESMLQFLSYNAAKGREAYAWLELAPPSGATNGDTYEGPVVMESRTLPIPANGIVTYSSTLKGRKTPLFTRAA